MAAKNFFKGYSLRYSLLARKKLEHLEKNTARKIHAKLLQLVEGAENIDVIKLENYPGYRLRCGRYRVVFEAIDSELVVYIVNIDHRKDAYRSI